MISLPVCRWRCNLVDGQYMCASAKYSGPPNVVSAQFCADCSFVDHEPSLPLPRALPCVHLGELLRRDGQRSATAAVGSAHQFAGAALDIAGAALEFAGAALDFAGAALDFACALHGTCRTEPADQHLPDDDRNCETCADYLARDPFGPDSATMRTRAEQFLAAIPEYPAERYRGRGVVIAGGGDRFFPSLYITVRALRHVGCRLPIQVWYLGRDDELPDKRQALLAAHGVECIDADEVRRRHPARRLDGWELKVFATLHSRFEEVLFLDADSYPCRNPEFLFEQSGYRARGAIFWPDVAAVDDRLKWAAFGVADPRRLGAVESGQFVIDKRVCWRPLNLAWFYNDHSDYYYRYCYGDKHTFEVAWSRCGQPFVMWQRQAPWVDVAFVQLGPDLAPLFVHRCRDKFRLDEHDYTTPQYWSLPAYHSSLPMEAECWGWLRELARLLHRKPPSRGAIEHVKARKKTRARKAQFAVATLYTPEISDLGSRTSAIVARYARRHRYQALIAAESLDASRPPAWSKLLLTEQFLANHPSCTWLMWIDADAVIMDPTRRLEDLVDDDVDFVIAKDRSPSQINTGVFLLRNCPAALDLLRRAYAKVQYLWHPLWEQPAVSEAIDECADSLRTRIVSRRLFNSFVDEYEPGDFVIHFAGCNHETKAAGVKRIIDSMGRRSKRTAAAHWRRPAGAR